MGVQVRIPDILRPLTQGKELVQVEADSVRQVLGIMDSMYPGTKDRICDEKGNLKRFVLVFVNDEDIRFMENLETKLSAGSVVSILPAGSGG